MKMFAFSKIYLAIKSYFIDTTASKFDMERLWRTCRCHLKMKSDSDLD